MKTSYNAHIVLNSRFNSFLKLLFIALFFINCGEDNSPDTDNNQIFLRCKINGILHHFNYNANANDRPAGDIINFVVVNGKENEDPLSPGFGFDLVVPEGATETTYHNPGNAEPEMDGKYYLQTEGGSTIVYMGGTVPGTSFTLVITSLSDWGVKGTFSGLLENTDDGERITVTEGEFSAPYN